MVVIAGVALLFAITLVGCNTTPTTQRFYADPDGDGIGTPDDYIVRDQRELPPTGYVNWLLGKVNDNCPNVYNPDQRDSNRDRIGDACSKMSLPPAH